MPHKFNQTLQVYNQYASKFVEHFEGKLDFLELDEFLNQIPPNGYILDAGCGSARDTAYFISKGYKALGIDLSQGLLNEAKKIHPEVPTKLMSLTEMEFEHETFDGVWCKAALLHLDRNEVPKVLESFFKILKPGGSLFVQTKAGEGEGTQPVPFDENAERLFTFFNLNEMETLISSAGFKIEKSYQFNNKSRKIDSRDQDWIVIFAKKI